MELLVLTGKSGAGKSVAAAALEDLGWYCIDNLPVSLVGETVRELARQTPQLGRLAVVVDCRSRNIAGGFGHLLNGLRTMPEVSLTGALFLDCGRQKLIQRFKETRRMHPLQNGNTGLEYALRLEEELLADARARADFYIDTTGLAPASLRERLTELFGGESRELLLVCMSFGFKYGLPAEADLVLDVRCLPNPFYQEALREKTGLDREVREYVLSFPEARTLLDKLLEMLDFLLPLYRREGKRQLTVALGCTGGRHRSVVMAQALAEHLRQGGGRVSLRHRDRER